MSPVSQVPFGLVVAGSTLADAFISIGIGLLAARSRRDPEGGAVFGSRQLLRTTVLTSLIVVAKLLVLSSLGVRDFGVIHLIYVDLVVLLPALGATLWLASRRWRVTTPVRIVALASLGMVPVGIYATWIEPFRLQLETATVPVSPRRAGKDVIRVGVLTDLQTNRVTDYERSAVARLMAERPDIILLPGDVFQGTRAEFDENARGLKDLLEQLSAPGGVYLVLGDVDQPGTHLPEVLRSSQVQLLVNEVVETTVRDRRVTIGGVELDFKSPRARGVVERLETKEGEGDVRILLGHRPDVALGLRLGSRIDLVVAGHTHGGQIVVPGYGPPLTLSQVPRAVAAGGLHQLRTNAIYVSRGVGCERGQAPRIRFLCPPEISVLDVGSGS